ncbi:RNHCP domain-containing protein [Gracilibacillus sp. S3-1-1]|uniref:RNHCP domain-containing protein n=1 Tax=Gracilibacillus pellucidus TaxID=3095368 RepID=A0ACC6M1X3_9BACI|nr:RNHCP domain-containing protein [Gracilibacillus sp. S3-1-1]MDX8044961.1 RNHCP domain-containing protein [Gracilibacillus sp. S3-1-1]
MSRLTENTAFQCENCGADVVPLTNGSFRNHCPYCLFSKHLDNHPGDRLSNCKGMMRPISLEHSGKKGFQIIHECIKCSKMQRNKVASDTLQEDNILSLITATSYY